MDRIFTNPVQFAKGVNLKDLVSSENEFQIDIDFKQTQCPFDLSTMDNVLDADEDSEPEDVYKQLEQKTEGMMLTSPEYHSFEDLEKKMIECQCIPSGAVKIKIIEEGNGPLVSPDAEVTVHYAAYWERAKIPFDSTLTMDSGKPLRMRLGAGRFLPGLEVALTNVKGPSSRFLALLQPAVSWGELGAPPRIRAEPALFVVALYDVFEQDIVHRFNDLPTEEQTKFETTIRMVQAIRNHGKELFNRKRYHRAIKDYQQAISVLTISKPENEEQEQLLKQLKIKIYLNLAVCYYRLNKPKYILNMMDILDTIVDVETVPKALYYYGRAYQLLGQGDKATTYLKKALKLEPRNKEIGAILSELNSANIKSAETEQVIWQKAFNNESPVKKKLYEVDKDFETGVHEVCQDMASRDEYSRFDLPNGLSSNEVLCIKTVASQYEGLIVLQDDMGRCKKVSIIRKP